MARSIHISYSDFIHFFSFFIDDHLRYPTAICQFCLFLIILAPRKNSYSAVAKPHRPLTRIVYFPVFHFPPANQLNTSSSPSYGVYKKALNTRTRYANNSPNAGVCYEIPFVLDLLNLSRLVLFRFVGKKLAPTMCVNAVESLLHR